LSYSELSKHELQGTSPRPDANATRVACVEQAYVCLRTTTTQSARASVLRFREYCLKYALNITVHGLLRHAVP